MAAPDTPYSLPPVPPMASLPADLLARLDVLGQNLDHLAGFAAALRLMSEDLNRLADTDETRAFWAVLFGIEAALITCTAEVEALGQAVKGGV